jgi:hypothetical protein
MAKVKIQGNASGTGVLTITAPNTSTDRVITLPDATATLATTADSVGGANGVDFNDDVKARFGTGNDLEIYHDGTDSYIHDSGSGNLELRTNGVQIGIMAINGSEYMGKFVQGNQVELYYNNSKKFETTATGIAVTGGVAIGGTGAANTLDDYEEGTYTGTLTPASGSLALYSGHDTLSYTKIGRMVHVQGKLTVQTNSSATGATNMNLPFTVGSFTDSADRPGCVTYGYFNAGGLNGSYTVLWEWTANTNQVRVYVKNSVSGAVNVSDYSGTGADVFVNIMYEVD